MARGIARSLDSRIEDIQAKLNKKQKEVAELKQALRDLEIAKQGELLEKVTEAAAQKGVSVEDLLRSAIK